MTSPTQRSLKHLREAGWHVAVVEKWIPFIKRRKDVWNFGDLLACRPDGRPMLVQTTSDNGGNVSARIKKAIEHPAPLIAWIVSGGCLIVHGWAKRGGRGERKRWTVREIQLSVADLTATEQRGVDDRNEPGAIAGC